MTFPWGETGTLDTVIVAQEKTALVCMLAELVVALGPQVAQDGGNKKSGNGDGDGMREDEK